MQHKCLIAVAEILTPPSSTCPCFYLFHLSARLAVSNKPGRVLTSPIISWCSPTPASKRPNSDVCIVRSSNNTIVMPWHDTHTIESSVRSTLMDDIEYRRSLGYQCPHHPRPGTMEKRSPRLDSCTSPRSSKTPMTNNRPTKKIMKIMKIKTQ